MMKGEALGFRERAASLLSADAVPLALIIAFSISAGLARFLLEAHAGFSLWDEGYLWYGVQRVLHREVPIRDFAAYDLGRYYWAAFFLKLFHERGIVAVRAATLAFSVLGSMCAGWLVLKGSTGSAVSRLVLGSVAIVLATLWMVPWWKSYDATISLILAASLVRVLERPVPTRLFWHGAVVGTAAVFGRNHGVYGVVAWLLAAAALTCCARVPAWRRCIPAWLAGLGLGYSPVLFFLLFDPGFAGIFKDGIHYMLFEFKSTNIYLPVPWPWTVHFTDGTWVTSFRQWLIGCCFVFLPLSCIVGVILLLHRVWRDRSIGQPVFAACVFTAIPYINVAFSRAEVGHLAQAILPVMVGILVLPLSRAWRSANLRVAIPLFVAASLFIALPLHPGYAMRADSDWKAVDVCGDTVWMDSLTASVVTDINMLAASHVRNGQTLLAAPVMPGAYALLGVRSPVWEIYPLTPRSEKFQKAEIARMRAARVGLVLIEDIALDGREDLRYENTHPVIWKYIMSHYRRLPYRTNDPQLKVYVPNPSGSQ